MDSHTSECWCSEQQKAAFPNISGFPPPSLLCFSFISERNSESSGWHTLLYDLSPQDCIIVIIVVIDLIGMIVIIIIVIFVLNIINFIIATIIISSVFIITIFVTITVIFYNKNSIIFCVFLLYYYVFSVK